MSKWINFRQTLFQGWAWISRFLDSKSPVINYFKFESESRINLKKIFLNFFRRINQLNLCIRISQIQIHESCLGSFQRKNWSEIEGNVKFYLITIIFHKICSSRKSILWIFQSLFGTLKLEYFVVVIWFFSLNMETVK